jgi:hypothetical protein
MLGWAFGQVNVMEVARKVRWMAYAQNNKSQEIIGDLGRTRSGLVGLPDIKWIRHAFIP